MTIKAETCKPLVSVIIPVYNTEELYLRNCLRPFMEHVDPRIEIIIVDDGSQEVVGKTLQRLTSGCPNEIRILHRENGGQNAARNTGIDASRGEYIEFLDSDDYIDWQAQHKVLDALETHKPDILGINVTRCTSAGVAIGSWGYAKLGASYHDVSAEHLLRECGALWNQLVRRDMFRQSDIRLLEGIYIGEDLASIVPLILSAQKIGVIGADLYRLVDRPTSITHLVYPERLMDVTKAFDFILDWMHQKGRESDFNEAQWMPEIERLAIIHVCFRGVGRAIDWAGVHAPVIDKLMAYMNQRFPQWRSNTLYLKDRSMHGLNYQLVLSGHYRAYRLCLEMNRALSRFKQGRN